MTKAHFLVISCSHFSIKEDEFNVLNSLGLKDDYDLIVLPGASLCLGIDGLSNWRNSLIEQIKLLKSVHMVEHIILLDHKNCAAYKNFYKDITLENEESVHYTVMANAKKLIENEISGVNVYRLLLNFDGMVQNLERLI